MQWELRLIISFRKIMMILMNKEFHYYVIWYLAAKAGFSPEDCSTIAIASQMVDDARLPWRIESESRQNCFTEVTQNYIFWDQSIAKNIYVPFHFLPGDISVSASMRIDGQAHPLAVSADSENARMLLIEALKTRNLYRIGIALHAYADTWAHQNFTGTQDALNAMDSNTPQTSMKQAAGMLPSVGHLQAGTTPDIPHARWKDIRLEPKYERIENRSRFLEAARMIYRFLCTFCHSPFDDEYFVIDPLRKLWESRTASDFDELAYSSDYVIYFDVPLYDPCFWTASIGAKVLSARTILKDISREGFTNEWRNEPFRSTLVRGKISASRYQNSPFHKWNEAVCAHRDAFIELMRKKGITIE